MGYGITYLNLISCSLRLLTCCLTSLQSAPAPLLSLKCQEIASVKYSFIVQVYCENRFTFLIQLEDEIRTLT